MASPSSDIMSYGPSSEQWCHQTHRCGNTQAPGKARLYICCLAMEQHSMDPIGHIHTHTHTLVAHLKFLSQSHHAVVRVQPALFYLLQPAKPQGFLRPWINGTQIPTRCSLKQAHPRGKSGCRAILAFSKSKRQAIALALPPFPVLQRWCCLPLPILPPWLWKPSLLSSAFCSQGPNSNSEALVTFWTLPAQRCRTPGVCATTCSQPSLTTRATAIQDAYMAWSRWNESHQNPGFLLPEPKVPSDLHWNASSNPEE